MGEARSEKGVTIAFADLLIGATGLQLAFGAASAYMLDFERILAIPDMIPANEVLSG